MRAAVIGYGKSGKSAEKILKSMGYADITVYDDRLEGMTPTAEFCDQYDMTAVSPGIDLKKMACRPEVFTSEIELADGLRDKSTSLIAVTGTNGKSTVTTLTAQVLNANGVKAIACGNIGLTYAEALDEKCECYVVELSSFQTGMLHNFSADCVIVTNIAEDHMDRYADLDEYTADKMNLIRFLQNDGRLIVEEDVYLMEKSGFFKGERIAVDADLSGVVRLAEGRLDFGRFYVQTDAFPLQGRHNLINLAFAMLAADRIKPMKGDVTHLITSLTGLEHRCEYVETINGVKYINDSKGTNVHSTYTALRGFDPGVVLILGGKDKNGDFASLAGLINEKCACVITYGYSGGRIYSALEGLVKVPLFRAEKMENAVEKAYTEADAGQQVVLSPACASFDQHNNFEHRGAHFKEMVKKLKKEGVNAGA
jgi:UDP-N-acetylmuramoylalanine--D-glutamate ligase